MQLLRIIKIAPAQNYERVTVTGQWHNDNWYRNDYGLRPDPLRSDQFRDQLPRPSFPWAPYQVQPLAGDPMFPLTEWGFAVQVAPSADGTFSTLACTGKIPVNDFSTTVKPPFVNRQGAMVSGGSLLGGGWTYYWAICAVDSDGNISPPSSVCATNSYAPGTFTATIPILSWDAATVGYQVFGGNSASAMTWQASGTGKPPSISIGALQAITYGIPDSEFNGLDIFIKRELHGGIWGAKVGAAGTYSLTFPGCAAGGLDYTGRIVSLVAKADGSPFPIFNCRVASNTADVLTIDPATPDPGGAGIAPGDVFIMRSKPTISGFTLTDPLWKNPLSNNGNGLIAHAEKGYVYRFIANTGCGYKYLVTDNTDTSHTLSGPWIQAPDATSVGIIEEPSWLPDSGDLSEPNNTDPAAVTTLIVPCKNYPNSTMFAMGITRDGGNNSPPEQMCPFREAYIDQFVTAGFKSRTFKFGQSASPTTATDGDTAGDVDAELTGAFVEWVFTAFSAPTAGPCVVDLQNGGVSFGTATLPVGQTQASGTSFIQAAVTKGDHLRGILISARDAKGPSVTVKYR